MSGLTASGRLMRLVLRRDRLRLALWILGLAGLVIVSAVSLLDIYPDQEAVQNYVDVVGGNPALVAFAGPGYGFDDPNSGVVLVNETQVFGALGMALMSIFLVIRHTRAEEDLERTDLLRSGIVGRHATTTAAVTVVVLTNLAIGLLAAVGFVAAGYEVTGSVALAGSLTAVGLVFAGVAAVAAQVAGSARAALGGASAALGAAFVVRAAGDISGNGLSWLSPIGWAQAVRAFADERWWTLALCLAVAVVLVAVAFWLSTRRDLGVGLRHQSAGPATAHHRLASPVGLAWRLQRGAVIGWSVGLLLAGIAFGSIGEDVDQLFEDNPAVADFYSQLGGASLTDSYLATSLTMLALIAGGLAVSAVLHLRSEEAAGRVEALLATPLGRVRWALGGLAVAVGGTVLTIAAGGLGTGLAYAAVSGDASQVPRLLGASLVTAPGILVLVGLTALLFGLVPRGAVAAWGVLAWMALVGYLGDVLQMPDWMRDLSPMAHLPQVPAESVTVGPIVALLVIAAALVAGGLWALRRRDLQLH
jgi:ABC-2 type transport system permease protein